MCVYTRYLYTHTYIYWKLYTQTYAWICESMRWEKGKVWKDNNATNYWPLALLLLLWLRLHLLLLIIINISHYHHYYMYFYCYEFLSISLLRYNGFLVNFNTTELIVRVWTNDYERDYIFIYKRFKRSIKDRDYIILYYDKNKNIYIYI